MRMLHEIGSRQNPICARQAGLRPRFFCWWQTGYGWGGPGDGWGGGGWGHRHW